MPNNARLIVSLLALVALALGSSLLFEQGIESSPPIGEPAEATVVDKGSGSSDTEPYEETSDDPAHTPDVVGPPLVRKAIVIEQRHIDWAYQTFSKEAFDPGYDEIEFVEFDLIQLVDRLKKSEHYVAEISGRSESVEVDSSTPDFWIDLFDLRIPLTITELSVDSTQDLTFINVRGVISEVDQTELKNVPGVYSWRFAIEENLGVIRGQIKTLSQEIEVQNTLDRTATVALLASRETLGTFPLID